MEKNVEISMLCQVYGKVLTEKQYELLDDYYNNDLSLSEIAENNNITRQAVRDIIKKAENKLYELEEQISLLSKYKEQEKIISNIQEELGKMEELINSNSEKNSKEQSKIVKSIKKELQNLI